MNKLNPMLIGLCAIGLSGCSATGKGSIEHDTGSDSTLIKLEVEVTTGAADSFLKPISSAIAFLTGVSSSDFNNFDPSDYFVRVSDTNALTSVTGVVAKIYDGNYLLAMQSFQVRKVGNDYFIKNPQSFKSWSSDYYDIADTLTMEMQQTTVYYGSGSTSSAFFEGNSLIDQSIRNHTCMGSAGENPYFCTRF